MMLFKNLKVGNKFKAGMNGLTYVKLNKDPVGFTNCFFITFHGVPSGSSLEADVEVEDLGEALLEFQC